MILERLKLFGKLLLFRKVILIIEVISLTQKLANILTSLFVKLQ